jgi:predicted dehydrogenase
MKGTAGASAVRFAVIGDEHPHAHRMTDLLLEAGAELTSCLAGSEFARRYPQARPFDDIRRIVEEATVQLVVCAVVPCERAALAIDAMRHGKDVLCAKPAVTSLEALEDVRRVSAETGRIWSVFFSERVDQPGTLAAADLVRSGAIGEVVHIDGFGPHRLHPPERPPWFFSREQSGGILADLGSHQADQFLFFTGCTHADVTAARVRRRDGFETFGEAMLTAEGASGYFRVDWLSPAALPTWGDGRLFIVGSEGSIEVRKNCDVAGRDGSDHVFLVNGDRMQYIDARATPRPFAARLLDDVRHRGSTAMPEGHAFRACELALRAQALADASKESCP